MADDIWRVTAAHGFLMADRPLAAWPGEPAVAAVLATAQALPDLVAGGGVRVALAEMPVPSEAALADLDERQAERLHQAYAFLANGYLWAPGSDGSRHLPAGLAVPFVALSDRLGRPPVLSYAGTQLANWQPRDAGAPLSPENLVAIQRFQNCSHEEWFWVIHIAIEAAGGAAVLAGAAACRAAKAGDARALGAALSTIHDGLEAVTGLARRIGEGCSPAMFYRTLRPFLFSPPEGVVFAGVARFRGQPQAFLGQTGAQSSLMPAICASLGIRHGATEMTDYLDAVRAYMPPAHRAFIAALDGAAVRRAAAGDAGLRAAYNACVDAVTGFRRFHLTLAATFIAAHVADPKGTGGTDFMRWLKRMTRETADQRLPV